MGLRLSPAAGGESGRVTSLVQPGRLLCKAGPVCKAAAWKELERAGQPIPFLKGKD